MRCVVDFYNTDADPIDFQTKSEAMNWLYNSPQVRTLLIDQYDARYDGEAIIYSKREWDKDWNEDDAYPDRYISFDELRAKYGLPSWEEAHRIVADIRENFKAGYIQSVKELALSVMPSLHIVDVVKTIDQMSILCDADPNDKDALANLGRTVANGITSRYDGECKYYDTWEYEGNTVINFDCNCYANTDYHSIFKNKRAGKKMEKTHYRSGTVEDYGDARFHFIDNGREYDMYVLIEADDPNNSFGQEYGVITPYYVRYENIDDPEKRKTQVMNYLNDIRNGVNVGMMDDIKTLREKLRPTKKMKKSIAVGNIRFDDDGYNDDTSAVQYVWDGEYVKSRDDGNWHYEYWRYAGRVIGLQWNCGTYVGMWLLDEGDESLMNVTKSTSSIHDMIAQTRQNNNSLVKSRIDLGVGKAKGELNKHMGVIAQELWMKFSAKTKNLQFDEKNKGKILDKIASTNRANGDDDDTAMNKGVTGYSSIPYNTQLKSIWDIVDWLYRYMRDNLDIDDRQMAEDTVFQWLEDGNIYWE